MTVSVTCDGKTSLVAVKDGTVKDMISRLGIMLGDDDLVSEPLYAPVRDGMSIQISRVSVEYNTVDMKIEHPISYVENNEMNEGKTEVVAEGRDGTKQVKYVIAEGFNHATRHPKAQSPSWCAFALDELKRLFPGVPCFTTAYEKSFGVGSNCQRGGIGG